MGKYEKKLKQWYSAPGVESVLVMHAREADAEIAALKTAIRETLEENPHLADGDNCTLIKLKRVMGDG